MSDGATFLPDAASEAEARIGITDLSSQFGVTTRALRFYEDEGLIAPERRGTHRLYSSRDRARLAWILRGKRVGFSLSDIRELLDLYDVEGEQAQRAQARAKCRDRIAALSAQRDDIDAAIAELQAFVASTDARPATD